MLYCLFLLTDKVQQIFPDVPASQIKADMRQKLSNAVKSLKRSASSRATVTNLAQTPPLPDLPDDNKA